MGDARRLGGIFCLGQGLGDYPGGECSAAVLGARTGAGREHKKKNRGRKGLKRRKGLEAGTWFHGVLVFRNLFLLSLCMGPQKLLPGAQGENGRWEMEERTTDYKTTRPQQTEVISGAVIGNQQSLARSQGKGHQCPTGERKTEFLACNVRGRPTDSCDEYVESMVHNLLFLSFVPDFLASSVADPDAFMESAHDNSVPHSSLPARR